MASPESDKRLAARRLLLQASALPLLHFPRVSLGKEAKNVNVGDSLALPNVKLIDGKTLAGNNWSGKVLVITKFATWCPFCKLTNPKLEKLLQSQRGKGLDVLALSIDRNPADVPKYMKDKGYSFNAAMWTSEWEQALGPRKGLPIFWVVGREGKVKQIETGELLDEDVAEFARWL